LVLGEVFNTRRPSGRAFRLLGLPTI